jgi:hypothetical protein
MMRLAAVAACALALLACGGCANSVGGATGAVAGAATGLVTANPAVGVGVGIAVKAATTEAVKRVMKGLHQDQQIAIAVAATKLAPGETGQWQIEHTLPLENGHGHVRVGRRIDTPLAQCVEFAFSVQDDKQGEDWYLSTICRNNYGSWRWAQAEPAVDRWGTLQ